MKGFTTIVTTILILLVVTVVVGMTTVTMHAPVNNSVTSTQLSGPVGGISTSTENLSQKQAISLAKWKLNRVIFAGIIIVTIWKLGDIIVALINNDKLRSTKN